MHQTDASLPRGRAWLSGWMVAAVLIGCDDPAPLGALTSRLEVDRDEVDFGEVWVGSSAAITLWLSNTGSAPIRFEDATIGGSPDFSAAEPPDTLAAGQTFGLELTFAPLEASLTAASLSLFSDADEGSEHTVALRGAGLPTPTCANDAPCRESHFDFVLGLCATTFLEGDCDDDNACTDDTRCVEGECLGVPRECADPGGCVLGYCDPDLGCVTELNHDACAAPDNPCIRGVCQEDGTCLQEPLEDGALCTVGFSCEEGAGLCFYGECVLQPTDGWPCFDGDLCTQDDVCSEGSCAPGTPVSHPPKLLSTVPLFRVNGLARASGPTWITDSSTGLVIWMEGVGGELHVDHLLEHVHCASRPITLPDDIALCIASDRQALWRIDLADGSAALVQGPWPSDDPISRFEGELFLHDGALVALATTTETTGHLLRAEDPAEPLFEEWATFQRPHVGVMIGGDWMLEYDTDPPGSSEDASDYELPRLFELQSGTPTLAFQLSSSYAVHPLRIDGHHLLARDFSGSVGVINLEDIPSVGGAGGVPVGVAVGTPVEGFREWRSIDLLDGVLLGLAEDEDLIVAQALDEDAVVPAPLPVPGAASFSWVGPRRWWIGPGRYVHWNVEGLVETRQGAPESSGIITRMGSQAILVRTWTDVSAYVPVSVGPGDVPLFGSMRSSPRAEGDANRLSALVLDDGDSWALPSPAAPFRRDLRWLGIDDGDLVLLGTLVVDSDRATLGVARDLLVERGEGFVQSRRFDPQSEEETVVQTWPWTLPAAPPDHQLSETVALDRRAAKVWIAVKEERPAHEDDFGPLVSPGDGHRVLLPRIEVEVLPAEEGEGRRSHPVELGEELLFSYVSVDAIDDTFVLYAMGYPVPCGVEECEVRRMVAVVPPGAADGEPAVLLRLDELSPTTHDVPFQLLRYDEEKIQVLMGRALVELNLDGSPPVEHLVLPYSVASAVDTGGAIWAAGYDTLTLVAPPCP